MKKTNFLKGLALAAVALVSGFATSCSEEELSIKNNPVELPAASASVSISVVDLQAQKLVGSVTTIDATASIGGTLTVECPANAGYTTAAPVAVSIPALQKGQSVNVPVTFYVVTLDHALAQFLNGARWGMYVDETTETPIEFTGSRGWVGNVYANTDENETVWAYAEWSYTDGYEYISAIEEETEEGSDVVASSRASETQIADLIKLIKPTVYHSGWWSNNIDPMIAWTLNVTQYVNEGKVIISKQNEETGKYEPVAEFYGKSYFCGYSATPEVITHDAPSHDAPTHDGHDGHGHGGNSNAGGGIGGDSEGE